MGTDQRMYLGGWGDAQARTRWFERAARAAGFEPLTLPDRLRIRDFGDKRFIMNYGPEPVALSRHIPGADGTLAPAEYVVVER